MPSSPASSARMRRSAVESAPPETATTTGPGAKIRCARMYSRTVSRIAEGITGGWGGDRTHEPAGYESAALPLSYPASQALNSRVRAGLVRRRDVLGTRLRSSAPCVDYTLGRPEVCCRSRSSRHAPGGFGALAATALQSRRSKRRSSSKVVEAISTRLLCVTRAPRVYERGDAHRSLGGHPGVHADTAQS